MADFELRLGGNTVEIVIHAGERADREGVIELLERRLSSLGRGSVRFEED